MKHLTKILTVCAVLPLLLGGCSSRRQSVLEVPIRTEMRDELHPVTLPGDTIVSRLLVDCTPGGVPEVRQAEGDGGFRWSFDGHALDLRGIIPPRTQLLPYRTIEREVPVEVEVVREVNVLHPWQRVLMGVGGATLLYLLVCLGLRLAPKRNHG